MESNVRTGREFQEMWEFLQTEARQCSEYLGKELEGVIAADADVAAELGEGSSSRQGVTEQREELREELREAVIREALTRPDSKTSHRLSTVGQAVHSLEAGPPRSNIGPHHHCL